jgi:hypothetical protein
MAPTPLASPQCYVHQNIND